jgi:hypothetical protein
MDNEAFLAFVLASRRAIPFAKFENAEFRAQTRFSPHLSAVAVSKAGTTLEDLHVAQVLETLPPCFGIVFDAWSVLRQHFLAVFAVFPLESKVRYELLGFMLLKPAQLESGVLPAPTSPPLTAASVNSTAEPRRSLRHLQLGVLATESARAASVAHMSSYEDSESVSVYDQDDEDGLSALKAMPCAIDPSRHALYRLTKDLFVGVIERILAMYGRTPESVLYMVGENCPLNKAVAEKMAKPFIGYQAYMLSLAIAEYMQQHQILLNKVTALMTWSRNINAVNHLLLPQRPLLSVGNKFTRYWCDTNASKMIYLTRLIVGSTRLRLRPWRTMP